MNTNGNIIHKLNVSYEKYEWINSARIAGIDGYQPPLYPDRNYCADKIVEMAKDINANTIRISIMGKLAHFATDKWECDEYIKNNDFLQQIIDLAHANDIRVVPYVPGGHNLPIDLLLKWHPEWLQRQYPQQSDSEVKVKPHSGTTTGFICPVGSYNDFYMEMIKKTILEHDVDGWYTDGWKDCYSEPLCYCDSCQEIFKKDFGENLFDTQYLPNGNKVDKVREWYHNRIINMVQNAHSYIKSKKDIPTFINGIFGVLGYQSQGSWGREVDCIHDVLHFERKTEPYNRYVSCGYLNVLKQKSWLYAGLYSPLQFHGPERAEENYKDERKFPYRKELYNECLITFACGCGVNLMRSNSLILDPESPGKEIIRRIYGYVKENADIYEGLNYLPYIGVLTEDNERKDFRGETLKKIVKKGLQAGIFKKEDLDDVTMLNKYSVLISESREKKINEKLLKYVRNGGRLITQNDLYSLAYPNISKLSETDFDAYMCGRGKLIILKQFDDIDDMTDAVRYLAEGYIPYQTKISNGEMIPIMSVKPGKYILHLINISDKLTDLFDQGLNDIKTINQVDIQVNIPHKTKLISVKRLFDQQPVTYTLNAGTIKTQIKNLSEFEALQISFTE